ncbi:MAG: oligosaccharide flippase family protein [Propionivibrio sp.]|nr:oligosaccharide flippase family protein [Propionivibrio sp.]
MVLLGFVATFCDLGAGQYLVQQKELTEERIRATWSVQLGLGLFIALLILAAAIPTASFYNEPRMLDIMLVLALNFAITPFLAFPMLGWHVTCVSARLRSSALSVRLFMPPLQSVWPGQATDRSALAWQTR